MTRSAPDRSRGLSPFSHKPFGGLSASALKCLALLLMLLDHTWATIASDYMWLTRAGRLAFPIFAFQLAEGFLRTSDRRRYAGRLLVFALLSEIPFNYLVVAGPVYPFHQNVMFTLLLGLLAIGSIETLRQERTWRALLRCLVQVLLCLLLATVLFVDYGATGVLTVLVFYLFRGFPFAWVGQLAGMVLLHIVTFRGEVLLLSVLGHTLSFPTQGFAVLALLPIWLYNGKKGSGGAYLQWGAYLFYPLHMVALYLLAVWLHP